MDILKSMTGFTANQTLVPATSACLRLGEAFTNNATFTPQHDMYKDLVQVSWYDTQDLRVSRNYRES